MKTDVFERLQVDAGGTSWLLDRAGDMESLWEAMGDDDFGDDERLPYWAEVWPAGIGFAQWLLHKPELLRGKLCLDLGCGLGLTAIAAAAMGGRVVGADYETAALPFAARNAALNGQAVTGWVAMDWRHAALKPGSVDVVLAADVVYERRFIEPLSDFLAHVLAPGGEACIAEPCRNFWPDFINRLRDKGWAATLDGREEARHLPAEGRQTNHPRTVLVEIWRLRPPRQP